MTAFPTTGEIHSSGGFSPPLTPRALKAKSCIKLQSGRRAIQRAGRCRAEDSQQTVWALVDDSDEREKNVRVSRVVELQAMHARVRLLRQVREVEGRQHRILFKPNESIVELYV